MFIIKISSLVSEIIMHILKNEMRNWLFSDREILRKIMKGSPFINSMMALVIYLYLTNQPIDSIFMQEKAEIISPIIIR